MIRSLGFEVPKSRTLPRRALERLVDLFSILLAGIMRKPVTASISADIQPTGQGWADPELPRVGAITTAHNAERNDSWTH